ncbi:MAG TPA: lipopolysaccharide transport periplasmic protein LptA [Gammaproteobacteria bacterium]|nr:lipopolysaccharide transport periplasmic protein LptA [Gammaproteobacteria bacterium]
MSRATELKLVLVLCGSLAAAGAWALKSDKSQPINIQADHGDFRADPKNNSNGTGIYTGHVVITQGSIKLTADKAILHVVNNELDTADVTGSPATFEQTPDNGEPMHGRALEITYDASKNQIDLITDAQLTQAVNQVNGQVTRVAATAAQVPAPGAVSNGPAPFVAQGERLLTADHIRYNTETQRMVATGGKDDGRIHITFPPKQIPGETQDASLQRQLDFLNRTAAPTSATHAAAGRTAAPAASTHPGA